MDSIDGILETIKGISDTGRQKTIARKVALNEAYFNIGIIDVIETKAVMASKDDRNKLILTLKTASRDAFDIYNIDKGFFGKFIAKTRTLFQSSGQDGEQEPDKFTGWTETEIHHYVTNRIDILKAIVSAGLVNEPKLRIAQRVSTIKHAIVALINVIGA